MVSGGRGLGSAANYRLVRELAEQIGGMHGASRAIVDDGWVDSSRQSDSRGRSRARVSTSPSASPGEPAHGGAPPQRPSSRSTRTAMHRSSVMRVTASWATART
ncbi:MAG: hypothetical protein IPM40_04255 [Gammaproteobacteria bacterium]|nr:hypothetical protein [Gammaproteobacteria bacterium]